MKCCKRVMEAKGINGPLGGIYILLQCDICGTIKLYDLYNRDYKIIFDYQKERKK